MNTNLKTLHLWRLLALTAILATSLPHAAATKVTQQVCGRLFLKDGSIVETTDSTRLGTPHKKHGKVVVVENAFTHNSREARVIDGADTDSVQIWQRTRTDRIRTLIYLPERGWAWKLESAGDIAVYAYSPDGYYLAGNGGMSTRGKLTMLVVKDGHTYEFEKTGRMANDNLRREVAAFVADDPALATQIMESRKTVDATLRMLGLYRRPTDQ